MHEPFDTLVELDWRPSRRDLRGFGFAAALVCALLAFGVAHWEWPDRASFSTVRAALLAGAALCLVVALVAPAWLRPLYVLLTCVSFPMRWLTAWASLLMLFFIVLTPIGWAVRRLRNRAQRASGSAWTPARKRPDRSRYFRQS